MKATSCGAVEPAFHKTQRAQRRGRAGARAPVSDAAEFQRRAAKIGHESLGGRRAQQHALRRKPRLVLSAGDADRQAGFALNFIAERRAVLGVAHGGGGDRVQRAHMHAFCEHDEPLYGPERPQLAVRVEAPRLLQTGAATAQNLFVEEIGGGPGRAFEHHKPDRVRSDVDHADPFTRMRTPGE